MIDDRSGDADDVDEGLVAGGADDVGGAASERRWREVDAYARQLGEAGRAAVSERRFARAVRLLEGGPLVDG